MKALQSDKTHASQAAAGSHAAQCMAAGGASDFVDSRPQAAAQRKYRDMAHASDAVVQQKALMDGIRQHQNLPAQRKGADGAVNRTGLPNQLKTGIESLSGMSMDHVKVHYNSSQPAQLNALAYAQGSDIHVGPGQEKHLPHEAWHVVQQAQGRVRPTRQMKAGVAINDDKGLEHEADVMGARAMVVQARGAGTAPANSSKATAVVQRATLYKKNILGVLPHWEVVFQDGDAENPFKSQVGFANPTGLPAMSGSVGTKSSSGSSGFGGEGEVHWTKLRPGSDSKGGYTQIVTDEDRGTKDHALRKTLPPNGTRSKYRLTSKNCQHFIVDAWRNASLGPDIAKYLTMPEQTGVDINNGFLGATATGLATVGAVTAGIATAPGLGAAAMLGLAGVGGGIALGRKGPELTRDDAKRGLMGTAVTGLATAGAVMAGLATAPAWGTAALLGLAGAGVGIGLGRMFGGKKTDAHAR